MEVAMPNWCDNQLTVKGENTVVEQFQQKAVGVNPWNDSPPHEQSDVLNFHSLVPIPAHVLQQSYEKAGYHWECQNWGCRDGAYCPELMDDTGGQLVYRFGTAWGPPIAFLKHLGKLWPDLKFLLEYSEPGMGIKGICKVHGELCENYSLQI
jgi:hypothetical protein